MSYQENYEHTAACAWRTGGPCTCGGEVAVNRPLMTARVRVTWTGATRDHLAAAGVRPDDVRGGSFPLMCGRWAPDPMDRMVDVFHATGRNRLCARCAQAFTKEIA
jgi:hypothetical protein